MLAIRWPIVLALAIVGVAIGWVTTPAASAGSDGDTVYRATNVSFIDAGAPTGLTPAQIAYLVTLNEVPELVAERIDDSAQALAAQVRAQYDGELGVLEITATDRDPRRAELVADTFAEVLDGYLTGRAGDERDRQRRRLVERIELLEEEVRALSSQLAGAAPADIEIVTSERESAVNELRQTRESLQELDRAGDPPSGIRPGRPAEAIAYRGADVIEEALRQVGLPPSARITGAENGDDEDGDEDLEAREELAAPYSEEPDPLLRAGLGGGAGLALGLGIIALMTVLDTRVRTRADAEEAFGLPVLVEVPRSGRKHRDALVLLAEADGAAAEAYRSLRTSLALSRLPMGTATEGGAPVERDVRVVLVSGADPGDGASTVSANLAAALAEAQMRVLVIDADFRQPRMSALLDADGGAPLSSASGEVPVSDVDRFTATTAVPGVWVARSTDQPGALEIPPSEMIAAQRSFILRARTHFDVIVVDTAPSLRTNDASDLVPIADAVLFAARVGHTSLPSADRAVEQFERLVAPMAGVVLLGSTGGAAARRGNTSYSGRKRSDHADNGRARESAVDVVT